MRFFTRTLEEIQEMDEESPDYAVKYLDKYKEARERSGIPEDKNDTSFMRYLDAEISDLEAYARSVDEEDGEAGDDYKVSRASGSTITVRRVEHELPEGEADPSVRKETDEQIIEGLVEESAADVVEEANTSPAADESETAADVEEPKAPPAADVSETAADESETAADVSETAAE